MLTERSSKDVFLTSLYKINYQQECIEAKRKKYLVGVRIVDAFSVLAPSFTLAVIGINPDHMKCWLTVLAIANVIIAAIRFFPFYRKSKELCARSSELEMLKHQMDLAWRMYQLNITSLEQFTDTHKGLFEVFSRDSSMEEVYDWKNNDIDGMYAKTMRYMEDYIANPDQISDLFVRIADKEDEGIEK
jgi:hypothetical protein